MLNWIKTPLNLHKFQGNFSQENSVSKYYFARRTVDVGRKNCERIHRSLFSMGASKQTSELLH